MAMPEGMPPYRVFIVRMQPHDCISTAIGNDFTTAGLLYLISFPSLK